MAPDNPRRRVTVLGFLLAMVLLPIGAAWPLCYLAS
jgi:hypothetical protein